MKVFYAITLLLLFKYAACFDYDGWLNIQLQHSLNCKNEKYCARAQIVVQSIRIGSPTIEQLKLNREHLQELQLFLSGFTKTVPFIKPYKRFVVDIHGRQQTLAIAPHEKSFITCTRNRDFNIFTAVKQLHKINMFSLLQELADIDGFYTIKSIVTSTDRKDTEFLTSVKARSFLESGLKDIINIWMLPTGDVIAVNIQVANSSEPLPSTVISDGHIDSNVYLHHIEQAPVPDTASYIQKLEREREAREKGEIKDNRSFLAKYWMYIVPIAIFVMISGATTPEQPAQNTR